MLSVGRLEAHLACENQCCLSPKVRFSNKWRMKTRLNWITQVYQEKGCGDGGVGEEMVMVMGDWWQLGFEMHLNAEKQRHF